VGLLDRLASTLAGGADVDDQVRAEIDEALAEGGAGNWAAAEVALLDLAARSPGAPEVQVALGEVRVRRGHDEPAVQAFGRAVDLSPQAVDGWLGLGEALVRLGRFEPAREALRKVLVRTLDPQRRARAHVGRGRVALALGEPGRAVRELRAAADLAPADYGVAHALGQALAAAGEREAFTWLTRASHAPGADPQWVLDAAAAAPDPADAEGLLRARMFGASPVPLAPAQRAALEAALAGILCQAGRPAEALPLALSAAATVPTSGAAARALAGCHEAAGQYGPALSAALEARRLGAPADLPGLVRLALGTEDRAALARVAAEAAELESATSSQPLLPAVRAFAEGRAALEDLVRLGQLAPTGSARDFVARALAPGEVPAGNLYALLTFARELASRTPELGALAPLAARAVEAFDRPLLVAVMGEFNAGKSTFVNALCGEQVAPVGVTPTTATINVLRHGPRGGRVLYHDGRAEELEDQEVAPFLSGLDDLGAAAVRQVEIFVPLDLLRAVEVVDTPGLNSLRPEHEAVARGFLTDADAIVWLFAVNQAAKATERDALRLAQAAGKRVLGVLNKADQASPQEIAEITAHVLGSLGDLVEVLLPLSARQASAAAVPPGAAAADDGGLGAVRQALDERFFSRARVLKRRTALGSLQRFAADALALSTGGEGAATPAPEVGAARPADGAADTTADSEAFLGALAAERLRLPARIEAGLRQAAAEVAELMQPRIWPFAERRSGPADRQFLLDLLDDAVFEATVETVRELGAATDRPPVAADAFIERFRAHARGVWRGGLVDDVLRAESSAGAARDSQQLSRLLAGRLPDFEGELFGPLEAATHLAASASAAARGEARLRTDFEALVRQARLDRPVTDLVAAVAALVTVG
jgi:tetratricopeptide (TPR) repeat protein/GTP-binding protein EngB required for normal cell division